MKRLAILPFILLLTGCPGMENRAPTPRSVFINGDIICFSVDKKDVLNYYRIESNQGGPYKTTSYKDDLNLSYPDSCIKPELNRGYSYHLTYDLNGEHYSDSFFLDNDGNH
ncbi:putative T6SS immunity periplasmic lipoprotein [Enterobacter asburiae]|uniref:putative T6SS immunity periplasmic lipoprotein n=1 Tax=Scandinavium sp. UTDF21-P1B TaxID=3446379 RepID=UPI003477026D